MPDSWRCIAISFFLLLMSALFSYSGAYIKALSEKKLEGDAEDGNKRAKRLFSIIRKGNRTVWSLNCAVVLSGLFASAFFCTGLSGSVSDWTGISVTMSLFILTLIFGIIFILLVIVFPGRLASRDTRSSENYKMSGFITFTVFIFMPLSIAMEAVSNIMLRIFGIDPRKLDENITEDEILQMVDISEESGNIESGEKEMIENIFDFTDITAADVMTHRTSMAAIDINASNDEIIDLIEQTGFSRFPVYQDDPDNIIGILNARRFFSQPEEKAAASA